MEYLQISHNKIEEINGIGNLPKLEGIDVENNDLKRVTNLKSNSIKFLNLSNNQIQEIDNIESKSLEKLDLSNNKLKRIRNLDHLPNLRKFFIVPSISNKR